MNLFDAFGGGGRFHDDCGFAPFHPSHSHYQRQRQQQQQRAREIQRQRAIEAERCRRAAAAEEERRRQLMYQQALLQREEQERVRRQQILRARAEAEAEAKRRAKLAEAKRQRLRQNKVQPKTAIVRGADGYLYRVFLDDDTYSDEKSACEQLQQKPMHREEKTGPAETESMHSASTRSTIYHDAIDDENATVCVSNKTAGNMTEVVHKKKSRKGSKGRKKGRKKITITVEDASDSECDDDFSAPWRNRRPGPGESWIEPVQQQHYV
jgi:hypothetical protein